MTPYSIFSNRNSENADILFYLFEWTDRKIKVKNNKIILNFYLFVAGLSCSFLLSLPVVTQKDHPCMYVLHECMHACVCVCARMCMYMCIYAYVCVHICIYACMYAWINAHRDLHTHRYTNRQTHVIPIYIHTLVSWRRERPDPKSTMSIFLEMDWIRNLQFAWSRSSGLLVGSWLNQSRLMSTLTILFFCIP